MNKRETTILIDGFKLKDLLESKTGKTIREISIDNGYSDSFLRMSVKTGKASASVITLARLYGIEPAEYEIKPEPVEDDTDSKQMSFDEIPTINKADIKIIKDAVRAEILNVLSNFSAKEAWATYDALTQTYTLSLKIRRENIKK